MLIATDTKHQQKSKHHQWSFKKKKKGCSLNGKKFKKKNGVHKNLEGRKEDGARGSRVEGVFLPPALSYTSLH